MRRYVRSLETKIDGREFSISYGLVQDFVVSGTHTCTYGASRCREGHLCMWNAQYVDGSITVVMTLTMGRGEAARGAERIGNFAKIARWRLAVNIGRRKCQTKSEVCYNFKSNSVFCLRDIEDNDLQKYPGCDILRNVSVYSCTLQWSFPKQWTQGGFSNDALKLCPCCHTRDDASTHTFMRIW